MRHCPCGLYRRVSSESFEEQYRRVVVAAIGRFGELDMGERDICVSVLVPEE